MPRKSRYSRALFEGVVIVGSILLAFGVDAWWDGIQERASERDYLSRIATDLAEMRQDIVARTDHYAMIADHGRAVMPILAGERPIPLDTLGFLSSALNASRMIEPVVARSAYDDLISTGNLRLIRDVELRNALSEFYGEIAYRLSPFDYELDKIPYREAVRGIIPADVQIAARTYGCLSAEPLACPGAEHMAGLGQVAHELVGEPGLERKLNLALQALLIRPGNTMRLEGSVAAGFGLVLENIDALLGRIEYGGPQ